MSAVKPTILIIHGAWHTPAHYQGLKSHLEGLGYPVILPLLLTCNNDNPPTSTLQDDINLIQHTTKAQIFAGKQIIAIMHSYGGIVGTAALTGLAPKPDSPAGTGDLLALIYLCAFVPHENQSLAGMFPQGLPPWLHPNAETGFLDVEDPGYHFYSDVPAKEKEKWIKELVVHSIAAQTTPIGDRCAWRDRLEVWYLACEGDMALPMFAQEGLMIEGLRKEGVEVKVERCESGHSPFLSMVERVGEVVEKAAKASST